MALSYDAVVSGQTLTEKGAVTFSSSGDPRLDYFFQIIENASRHKTVELLSKSWNTCPLDTLKIMANLRDCRKGKGIRKQFQWSLSYVYENHPETVIGNMIQMIEYGYYKDLLQFLMMVLFDGDLIADNAKPVFSSRRSRMTLKKQRSQLSAIDKLMYQKLKMIDKNNAAKDKKASGNETHSEVNKKKNNQKDADDNDQIKLKKSFAVLKKSRNRFSAHHLETDPKYRKLYDRIVEVFANGLVSDLKKMEEKKSVSLIGKWAPSPDRHHDKYTGICAPIALKICTILGTGITDTSAALIHYQTKVLSPLRKYLKIPEVYMSAKLWSELDYNRVAAKCMQRCRELFIAHDQERFTAFLASKTKVAGATLKPVELVQRGLELLDQEHVRPRRSNAAIDNTDNTDQMNAEKYQIEVQLLEKQWISLCEDIAKNSDGGLLSGAISICDVSGSMAGEPLHAALGLTILTMTMTAEPWNSLCITFHENPEMFNIDPELSFLEKLKLMRDMPWGGTTDFQSVFRLILETAQKHQLTFSQMPQLIFVFTDMEFDAAFPNCTETNFEIAKKQFSDAGYQLPPIVFWNLQGNKRSMSTPVTMDERGTVLLSGFSGQQLSYILKHKDFNSCTPMSFLREIIDCERYDNLKIYD